MNVDFENLHIAIIGGNDPCQEVLEILLSPEMTDKNVQILMVADTLEQAKGIQYAREHNIRTSINYEEVCSLFGIEVILKFKNDEMLSCILEKVNMERVSIIDLDEYRAMSFLNFLRAERDRNRIKNDIRSGNIQHEEIVELFDSFSEQILKNAEAEKQHLTTEREDLIEMEKEMSQVIQGSMIPTFIINSEHIITHWNRACEELTGHPAYELVGTDRQWVPFRSAKRPTMADVIVGGMSEKDVSKYYGTSWRKSGLIREAYEAEEFFPHLGEGGKWIFFTAAPIKSPDGKVIGAIETLKDMTEDKKIQEELQLQDEELSKLYEKYKKSEEKYRSLFNNNPNPIFIIDETSFEILDVNHRVQEDYGFHKNELLGSLFLDLCDTSDDTIKNGLKSLAETKKAILLTKKKHYKKNKLSFFVNIKVVRATYSNRKVLIASCTDITESVEKDTQLIQAGKLATLGTMAAGMAHEINQPLNVIQICADLILKMMKKGVTIPEDELKEMAKDIIDNVDRASGVIKHVRDFARQSERDLKKLVINDPINDVFKVLGHQLMVHSIKVELDLDEQIPEIRAEHNRLEQIFINLVTNAIDSMDEKEQKHGTGIEKTLKIKTYQDGYYVVSEVSDTGMGMSDDVKTKIFEPFFTTKDVGKGTGLGTSISFGIIKDYGGTIDIQSELGKGAVFIIKFPAIQ